MSIGVCRRCTRTWSSLDRYGLCWACRAPRRRRRRTAERRAAVRTPPACPDPALRALLSDRRLKAHLVALHGERCMACGAPGPVLLDHRRPLWSLTALERAQPRWFGPFNAWLLCRRCERAKTARETRERALLRRRERLGRSA